MIFLEKSLNHIERHLLACRCWNGHQLTRPPSNPSRVGRSVSAAATAVTTTTIVPIPKLLNRMSGMISMPARVIATATPGKSTVRLSVDLAMETHISGRDRAPIPL